MIFKRRRRSENAAAESAAYDDRLDDEQDGLDEAPDDEFGGDDDLPESGEFDTDPDQDDELEVGDVPDRPDGPYDISEVEADAMAAERIDFGGVQVPLVEGLEIRVEVDQETDTPMAVTLVRGQGAVQVRAFAAPRSGGTWHEAVDEIRREFTEQGGTVDQTEGPFGLELRTMVAGTDEQGRNVVQPLRFVGVEGPRWMLQGILFGEGTVPETAGDLEELFRSVVVVRGEAAMRPGTPLPLSLPEQVPGDAEAGFEEMDEDLDEVEDVSSENGQGPLAR